MKSYLDKLLLDQETNEFGTDFAKPEDRQSAAAAALKMQMDEMTGEQPNIQIPMAPEMEENEVQQEVNDIVEADNAPIEDTVSQTMSAPQREPASTEEAMVDLSPQEQLLEEFRKYKMQQAQQVQNARNKDADVELMDDMNKAFQQIGTGLASGYANVKMNPIDIDSNFEDSARKDSKSNLENMMQEYKLLSKGADGKRYFNTSDGIVAVDKETGDTELVRKSELKNKREDRLQKKDEFAREVKGRLSDKEVDEISQLDEGSKILSDIDNILSETDVDKDLGPYASRIESASDLIPGVEQDPDFVKMQQLVGVQLADYVKSISGAAVSEQEAQRLLKNIPNMTDKPQAFRTKLDQFKKILKEAKDTKLKNIGRQKEGAEKFQEESDTVMLQAPNGVKKRVKRDKMQKYLDKGAVVVEE